MKTQETLADTLKVITEAVTALNQYGNRVVKRYTIQIDDGFTTIQQINLTLYGVRLALSISPAPLCNKTGDEPTWTELITMVLGKESIEDLLLKYPIYIRRLS